jgi:hypothetical protein
MMDEAINRAVALMLEARSAKNLQAEITACVFLHEALEAATRRALLAAQQQDRAA